MPKPVNKYSRVNYLYRDAGNYKFRGSFEVAGDLSFNQIQEFLIYGEYFIPEKVGVSSLAPEVMNDDDHQLHEIEGIVSAERAENSIPASNIKRRFKKASQEGWF